jgi:hypothetical protein
MPYNPNDDDPLDSQPRRERRTRHGRPGSLRWVREILGRPLVLEKRGLSLHIVLKDRRRRPGVIRAEAMTQLLFELELHLVGVESPTAGGALRHLATVHDALLRKGWAGVADLPSNTLARAVVQAQMVSRRDATSRLRNFIEHLGRLQVAAEVREDRLHHAPPMVNDEGAVEVRETSAEEFDASEREWAATVLHREDRR